jgi:hypothetical protein
VAKALVRIPEGERDLLTACQADVKASGLIAELVIETAPEFGVDVTLAPPDAAQEKKA